MTSASMFVSYNKDGVKPECRVGNWAEERALLETTGFTRGPRPKQPGYNLNATRCIEHTERTEPRDYNTTHREQHSNPAAAKHAQPRATEGERSRRQLAALQAQVDAEFEEEERQQEIRRRRFNHISQHRAHFDAAPRETYLEARTFRTHGPRKTEPELPPYEEKHFTEGNAFETITLYSEAKRNGDPLQRFPGTFVGTRSNPFLRSSALTNDIKDASKFHIEGHLCFDEGQKMYAEQRRQP